MNYTKEEIKHRDELRAFLIVDGKKAFIEQYGEDVYEDIWSEIVAFASKIQDPDQRLTYLECWGIPYKLGGADCSTDWA